MTTEMFMDEGPIEIAVRDGPPIKMRNYLYVGLHGGSPAFRPVALPVYPLIAYLEQLGDA